MNTGRKHLTSSTAVKDFLSEKGATEVGIAPATAFADAPCGHRATDLVPEAKSVIVMGLKLVSGVVNWPHLVWDDSRDTRFACWRVYDHCGFDAVNMRLEQMAMDLAIALELQGQQTIFFPGSNDMTVTELNALRLYGAMDYLQLADKKKITDLKAGLELPSRYGAPFSFRHAAVAAGLATFGANNLALHPVFGPRMRFNVVITDKELDQYDRPLTESVCLYDKGCGR